MNQAIVRNITEVRISFFTFNGAYGTEMKYLLNGHPALARVWWVMSSPEEARMWLLSQR